MLSPQAQRIQFDAIIEAQVKDFNKSCQKVPTSEKKKALSPLKVLIVEDLLLCQKVTLSMLPPPHFLTDVVATGEDALEKYSQGFDLILLDLGLPQLSGFEVCQIIRKERSNTKIPIIAYSAAMDDSVSEECFAVGFSGILSKPCTKEQLHAILQAHSR
jgi:CheY-like chemotaxis protein